MQRASGDDGITILSVLACLFCPAPRQKWTVEELAACATLMDSITKQRKPPSKEEVTTLQGRYGVLAEKNWKIIKFRCWAMFQQTERKKQKLVAKLFK
jgi:hypothetical protein